MSLTALNGTDTWAVIIQTEFAKNYWQYQAIGIKLEWPDYVKEYIDFMHHIVLWIQKKNLEIKFYLCDRGKGDFEYSSLAARFL